MNNSHKPNKPHNHSRCAWYVTETTAQGIRKRRCLRYAPVANYWLGSFYCPTHFDLALVEQGTTDDFEQWLVKSESEGLN